MANERITEDIVRDHFKKDPLYEAIKLEEKQSDKPKIDKLLQSASKSGKGKGYPEFIITSTKYPNLVIVIECKADILKHESETRKKYKDYAVDGVLLYSDYISKEFDVLAIAVSGEKPDNIKVSYFIQRQGKEAERIFGNKLIPLEDIFAGISQDIAKRTEKYDDLLSYSKELNSYLHEIKIKEDKRSLLVSGILLALESKEFYRTYIEFSNDKTLAKHLVATIENQLENEDLQGEKIQHLMHNYSFIKSHPSLTNKSNKETILLDLINEIDEKINGYVRTYKYFDVLGQFYIEFLRYSNSDKGLGIVLTPPHITNFFCDIVNIRSNDIVYDNCTGTAGFLVSAMKAMIEKCDGDLKKASHIKQNQLFGVEYQPEIYPLAVSNMFLHGDGKSNILSGDCFDESVKDTIKSKKPTVAFLNPPYKADKKKDTEELEFVLNALECLEPKGRCVAIIPMSCVLAQKGKRLELKERILEKHTLKAVFSMPDELFNNSKVSTNTCIIVFEAHIPHPNTEKTFFGYYKDDGFFKRKTKGRYDYLNKWEDIKNKWIRYYTNKTLKEGLTTMKQVKAGDEWCAEAYMETDYSQLNDEDFIKDMKEFVAFKFLHGDKPCD